MIEYLIIFVCVYCLYAVAQAEIAWRLLPISKSERDAPDKFMYIALMVIAAPLVTLLVIANFFGKFYIKLRGWDGNDY